MENTQWKKYNLKQLQEACAKAECWADVIRALGISDSSNVTTALRRRVREHNIDVSHFLSRKDFSKRNISGKSKGRQEFDDARRLEKVEKIKSLLPDVTTWTQLAIKLGFVPSTHQFKSCQEICKEFGFDTSHFVRNVGNGKAPKWTEEKFFVKDCTALRTQNREIAIRLGFKPTKCSECKIPGKYNGKPIVLELDHIDGIWNNNSKDNLRWLCPNCHSQTKTYRRRNSKRE